MISLLQDLNRNIFRIRLFNNNNIADWKLDDERIIKTGAAKGRPCNILFSIIRVRQVPVLSK